MPPPCLYPRLPRRPSAVTHCRKMRPLGPLRLGAPLAALLACAAPDQRPPNVLVVLADDLGWGDLGCYGGALETPRLDELAAQGVRLLDHHSGGAVCSPTRASLLTGRYPGRAGIPGVVYADPKRAQHAHGIGAGERTLPEVLRDVGYRTALVGKWHLGYLPPYSPTRHGFDRYRGFKSGNVDYHAHVDQAGAEDWWSDEALEPEEGYLTRLLTEHALEFLEDERGSPFFLLVAHGAPHYPYQGPDDPAIRSPGTPRGPQETSLTMEEKRARYAVMVQELDRSVGALVDRLESLGLRDDTVVLFLSDNGSNSVGSNGPWRGHKGSLWEGGHRVPCLVSWPGRLAPRVAEGVTHTNDWLPTLAALAGAPAPGDLDGVELERFLRGEAEAPARALYWEHNAATAMREGRWKLLVDRKGRGQLFDLVADPAETSDLAAKEPERAARMQASLEAWNAEVKRTATQQPAG